MYSLFRPDAPGQITVFRSEVDHYHAQLPNDLKNESVENVDSSFKFGSDFNNGSNLSEPQTSTTTTTTNTTTNTTAVNTGNAISPVEASQPLFPVAKVECCEASLNSTSEEAQTLSDTVASPAESQPQFPEAIMEKI